MNLYPQKKTSFCYKFDNRFVNLSTGLEVLIFTLNSKFSTNLYETKHHD